MERDEGSIWPVIGAAVILVLIIGAILLLSGKDEMPVKTTYTAAQNAMRAQGISEVIIPDLTNDFISGNYSLKELAEKYPGYEEDIIAVNQALATSEDAVVVTVNGEEIMQSELELQKSLLPPQYQDQMNDGQILAQMIDERLLLQEAAKRDITIEDADVDAAYQKLLVEGNLTPEQLAENLGAFGLDKESLNEMITRQLMVNKLFEEAIDGDLEVSDEEARAFYDENPDLFASPDQVTVRHILIGVTEEQDDATAKAIADEALARYEAGEDFCALVEELTNDQGSKNTCGEYTFPRGFMVPEFEEASFEMTPGETRIVKTQFGYHIILKEADVAGETKSFEESVDVIKAQLSTTKRTALYQEFIKGLRDEATILFPGDENEVEQEVNELENTTEEVTDSSSDVTVTIVEPENTTEVEEPETTVEPEATEFEEPEVEAVEEENVEITGLAGCLETAGAKLYVADWATSSMDEASRFEGASFIVDCSAGCDGASAFPTWEINGEQHLGSLSDAELATLADC